MSDSPIHRLAEAMDQLDVAAVTAQLGPHPRLMTADSRRAEGADEVRGLITEFFSALRSTTHKITAEWHQDNVWIAEIQASYVLRDWLKLEDLQRVFIAREGTDGVEDLRVYGAHERLLTDHPTGGEGMWVGNRWIPPL